MEKFIVIKLPLVKAGSYFYVEFDKAKFQNENNMRLATEISKSVEGNELVMIFTGQDLPAKKQSILERSQGS